MNRHCDRVDSIYAKTENLKVCGSNYILNQLIGVYKCNGDSMDDAKCLDLE